MFTWEQKLPYFYYAHRYHSKKVHQGKKWLVNENLHTFCKFMRKPPTKKCLCLFPILDTPAWKIGKYSFSDYLKRLGGRPKHLYRTFMWFFLCAHIFVGHHYKVKETTNPWWKWKWFLLFYHNIKLLALAFWVLYSQNINTWGGNNREWQKILVMKDHFLSV